MKSVVALVLLATLMVTMAPVIDGARHKQGSEAKEDWFEMLPQAKPKYTKLSIYIHDILRGADPSFAVVAQANGTAASPTQFGLIEVIDDQLTVVPDLNKKKAVVGHLEGFHISASKKTQSLLLGGTLVFTDGKYKDSTLTILGRITRASSNMVFPVLGGTGYFPLAQGVVTAQVYQPPNAQGHQIVELTFKLVHY